MNDEQPLVCICLPTYNAAATVRETLESILAQSYSNLIVHVSDNASTDHTLEVVRSISDPRLHIHPMEENIGGENNFNRCIQLSGGKYTAIFHADDIYEPDMVAKQVAFLEAHPEAGAVFAEASMVDEAGKRIGQLRLPKGVETRNGMYDFPTMFKAVMRHYNFFICPSAMARTEIYKNDIKCWRGELFGSSADLDVWFRILQSHPVGYLTEPLMRYRVSKGQFSSQIRMQTEKAIFFRVLDYYLGQDEVKAFVDLQDRRNYIRLERRDRVGRAINLFLTGEMGQARALCHDVGSWDAIRAAFGSRQGRMTLFAGIYVWLLAALKLDHFGRLSLGYIKRVAIK